jgi:hypothetical protein
MIPILRRQLPQLREVATALHRLLAERQIDLEARRGSVLCVACYHRRGSRRRGQYAPSGR